MFIIFVNRWGSLHQKKEQENERAENINKVCRTIVRRIDLGKRTYEMAVVGKGGKVTKSNGKTYLFARRGLYNKLRPGDKVAECPEDTGSLQPGLHNGKGN